MPCDSEIRLVLHDLHDSMIFHVATKATRAYLGVECPGHITGHLLRISMDILGCAKAALNLARSFGFVQSWRYRTTGLAWLGMAWHLGFGAVTEKLLCFFCFFRFPISSAFWIPRIAMDCFRVFRSRQELNQTNDTALPGVWLASQVSMTGVSLSKRHVPSFSCYFEVGMEL